MGVEELMSEPEAARSQGRYRGGRGGRGRTGGRDRLQESFGAVRDVE